MIVLGPVAGVVAIIMWYPVIGCLVALILRYTSCWNRLERLYLDKNASFTKVFGLSGLRIVSPYDPWGSINSFRHVFWIGTADRGLLFRAVGPLRLLFRPILIPWDEFLIANQGYIGTSRDELILERILEVQIILSGSVTNRLRQVMDTVSPTL